MYFNLRGNSGDLIGLGIDPLLSQHQVVLTTPSTHAVQGVPLPPVIGASGGFPIDMNQRLPGTSVIRPTQARNPASGSNAPITRPKVSWDGIPWGRSKKVSIYDCFPLL